MFIGCVHYFLLHCSIGGADNTARAWTLSSSKCAIVYEGHGSAVTCLTASVADRELYTGSSDGTARSWDIETGQPMRVFDGHQSAVTCIQVGCRNAQWLL